MNELALFAGAGGGLYASALLGHRCVCAVEIDDYARCVLLARQADGVFPQFPVWDDVCTFNGKRWRGRVDLISGGFPCQDVSVAGPGTGVSDGSRSGLWREYARIIGEVQPEWVFAENSPMLASRGLNIVLSDLSRLGYDAAWTVLSAAELGAPHLRKRMWVLARRQNAVPDADRDRWAEKSSPGEDFVDALAGTPQQQSGGTDSRAGCRAVRHGSLWVPQPGVGRMADGVAYREHRIKCVGNGQVPCVAAAAFISLQKKLLSFHI